MTKAVAILNLTPDSFSDGGKYNSMVTAEKRIGELQEQGAKIIDIGAESTRPGASLLSQEEEWQRLEPVLQLLKNFPGIDFSIDTRHPETAKKSIKCGAGWINDVSGASDPAMLSVIKETGCRFVIMHNLGLPADIKKTLPENSDPIREIMEWAQKKLSQMENAGINLRQTIIDPGIGFGKTQEQSWKVIRRAAELKKLPSQLMFGHSRKSFLSCGRKEPPEMRQTATDIVTAHLVLQEIDYLRVHDFRAAMRAIEIAECLIEK